MTDLTDAIAEAHADLQRRRQQGRELGAAVHVQRSHLEPDVSAERNRRGTLITFTHTVVGPFPEDHRPQLITGWAAIARVRKAAETGGAE